MSKTAPKTIYRREYEPPAFVVDEIDMIFRVGLETTTVRTKQKVRRNPEARHDPPAAGLSLSGVALDLREVKIDGTAVGPDGYEKTDESLYIPGVPDDFSLETVVDIHPAANAALEGLYASSGNLFTQCEAHGFRRITYSLDRPDVQSRFHVTMIADKTRFPVLLSNGNRIETGDLPEGLHFAKWEDPFRKPTYLFALVAGNLEARRDVFRTMGGRDVQLEVWADPGSSDQCAFALDSLKRAMKWDEDNYGLEYDLDLYMIVSTRDFNMGAMENKGLNVFNSSCVLAHPLTSTDDEFERVEAVIAHEYFHNWTGNRVTCRDWFQLTLKEGLTVYRDASFSADTTSAAVKRVADVRTLRAIQFPEDAGPMAHPIRPESYIEVNNFYTATVYDKGAEVVGMYATLLGRDGFRKGMDLYFQRHDGQAATCDDFRAAMADANGVDLDVFENWYRQAGTPHLKATGSYDSETRRYTLTLTQAPPSGWDIETEPYLLRHIPVEFGLIHPDGKPLPLSSDGSTTKVLELTSETQDFVFDDITAPPVPSVLRRFSAPVHLERGLDRAGLLFLMAHDTDAFNRWDALQTVATASLLSMVTDAEETLAGDFVSAWGAIVKDDRLDGSSKAMLLDLPSDGDLGRAMDVVAVDDIKRARASAMATLATTHWDAIVAVYEASRKHALENQAVRDMATVHHRRLANVLLRYLDTQDQGFAQRQFAESQNMTDSTAALRCLVNHPNTHRAEALDRFYDQWQDEPGVIDRWFAVQAGSSAPDTIERVLGLAQHPAYSRKNPNRFRALVRAFSTGNPTAFHRADGAGYAFIADEVLTIDQSNPQVAARLVSAFTQLGRYDNARKAKQRAQVQRIADTAGLSKDVFEIVSRILGDVPADA